MKSTTRKTQTKERLLASRTRKAHELETCLERAIARNPGKPESYHTADSKKATAASVAVEAATATLTEMRSLARACNARLETLANQ